MARMPGAIWLGEHSPTPHRLMTAHDAVCVHTIVGLAPAHAAHFSVKGDGTILQSRDTAFMSGANLNGNPRVIAVENEDHGAAFKKWTGNDVPALTPAQVAANALILKWANKTHGVPLQLCPDSRPGSRGLAYHRQGIDGNFKTFRFPGRVRGGEVWTLTPGKVCPGDRRIAQLPEILAAARPQVAKPLPAPKGVPREWAHFLHAKNPAVSDSIDAAAIAVAKGLHAGDVNVLATLGGVAICLHWRDPLNHGWKWDAAAHPEWKALPKSTPVDQMTLEQVGHLFTIVNGKEYRIPTFRDQARSFAEAGIRMELEAKNSPWLVDTDIWTRIERIATAVGLDYQVKAESWVAVPGKAAGIFKAVKAGTTSKDRPHGRLTILLPRGLRRIRRGIWRWTDFVRGGPVIWIGPTPKEQL